MTKLEVDANMLEKLINPVEEKVFNPLGITTLREKANFYGGPVAITLLKFSIDCNAMLGLSDYNNLAEASYVATTNTLWSLPYLIATGLIGGGLSALSLAYNRKHNSNETFFIIPKT